jgi:hypothetical protein
VLLRGLLSALNAGCSPLFAASYLSAPHRTNPAHYNAFIPCSELLRASQSTQTSPRSRLRPAHRQTKTDHTATRPAHIVPLSASVAIDIDWTLAGWVDAGTSPTCPLSSLSVSFARVESNTLPPFLSFSLHPFGPPLLARAQRGCTAPIFLFPSHDRALTPLHEPPHPTTAPRAFGDCSSPVDETRCPILSTRAYSLVFHVPRPALYGVEQPILSSASADEWNQHHHPGRQPHAHYLHPWLDIQHE